MVCYQETSADVGNQMAQLVTRQQHEVMAMHNKQSEEMLRLHHVHEQQIRDAQRPPEVVKSPPDDFLCEDDFIDRVRSAEWPQWHRGTCPPNWIGLEEMGFKDEARQLGWNKSKWNRYCDQMSCCE